MQDKGYSHYIVLILFLSSTSNQEIFLSEPLAHKNI